jgi:uncharacterized membrane protein YdjX (TVP38/TMEM64 family)
MRRLRLLWFVLLGLVLVLLIGPLRGAILGLGHWFAGAGVVGIVLYFALFTVGSLLVVPGSALTLLAGFAYGVGAGFAIAVPAATLAAWINFMFARTVGRRWVQRRLGDYPRLAAVSQAAAKEGMSWVILLRLSPVVPFSVLNYLMGVSQIRARDFIIASTIGKAPSVLAYVYLGSALSVLTSPDQAPQSVWTERLFWVGLGATLIVVLLIGRVVRRKTEKLLGPPEAPPLR